MPGNVKHPVASGFRISNLPNGIRVATESMPHAKSVAVAVSVGVGSRYENKNEQGISHLLEHMLYRGTKNYTDDQIDWAFAKIGAEDNAATSTDVTEYHAKTPPEHAGRVVELLADIIKNPTFDSKNLKPEKGAVLEEILKYGDDAEDANEESAQAKFFPRHQLGKSILGTQKSVRSFTQADLKAYMKKHYHPDNMVLSAAGNIDHDAFVATVKQHFGDIPKTTHSHAARLPFKKFDLNDYHGGDVRKKRDLDQVHILIGAPLNIPRDSEKFKALELYADILATFRLYREARKKRGLTYRIKAFTEAHEEASVLRIQSAASPKKAEELSRIICEQIAEMAKGVTPEELANAKTRLRAALTMNSDDTEYLAEDIGEQILLSGKYTRLEDALKKIEKVTLGDVNKLAAEVAASKLTVATLGDNKSKVPPQWKLQELLKPKPERRGRSNSTRGDTTAR